MAAALLLARAFERDSVYSLVVWAALWGFAGAKIYYPLEHLPTLTMHDLGRMGFTWYGGLIGGVVAALVIVRRRQLPLGVVAGVAAVALTVAYGIGRLGCLAAGDGTYGNQPLSPWAKSFPNGVVPTACPCTRLPCTRPWPPWRSPPPMVAGQGLDTAGRLWCLPRAERDLRVPRGVPVSTSPPCSA